MKKKINAEQAAKMRKEGKSLQQIADEFGVSRQAVQQAIVRFRNPRKPRTSCVFPIIAELMAAKGIAPKELAKGIGVSETALRSWLRGKWKDPLLSAIKMKECLQSELPVEELFKQDR